MIRLPLLSQTPAPAPPPLPPLPPIDPVIVTGGVPDWVGAVAIVAVVVGALLLAPLVRALARRLDGHSVSAGLRAEIAELHDRLGAVDRLEARVEELESRLEFSERLLTRAQQTLADRRGADG